MPIDSSVYLGSTAAPSQERLEQSDLRVAFRTNQEFRVPLDAEDQTVLMLDRLDGSIRSSCDRPQAPAETIDPLAVDAVDRGVASSQALLDGGVEVDFDAMNGPVIRTGNVVFELGYAGQGLEQAPS